MAFDRGGGVRGVSPRRWSEDHRGPGSAAQPDPGVDVGSGVVASSAIPLWAIWIAIALNVVPVAVTAASQVPIQREFDRNGMSTSALHRLVRMEWLRSIPHSINALLFIWAMQG